MYRTPGENVRRGACAMVHRTCMFNPPPPCTSKLSQAFSSNDAGFIREWKSQSQQPGMNGGRARHTCAGPATLAGPRVSETVHAQNQACVLEQDWERASKDSRRNSVCCADVKTDLCGKHLCSAEFQVVKGQAWTCSHLLHLMQTNLSNKLQS